MALSKPLKRYAVRLVIMGLVALASLAMRHYFDKRAPTSKLMIEVKSQNGAVITNVKIRINGSG